MAVRIVARLSPADARRRRCALAAAGTATLLTVVGCWQEIRYAPQPETARTPDAVEAAPAAPESARAPERRGIAAEVVEGQAAEPAAPPVVVDDLSASRPEASILEPSGTDQAAGMAAAELTPEAAVVPTAPEPTDAVPAPMSERTAAAPAAEAEEGADAAAPPSPYAEAGLEAPTIPGATPRERALIWQAASKWSFAAALAAKQVDASRYEPLRAEAIDAAAQLALQLPSLPAATDRQALEAAIIVLLSDKAPETLAAQLNRRYAGDAAALARLALHSHQLLLTYSPRREDLAGDEAALRATAEAADVPGELWSPLAALLAERADFVAVRSAVFELHRRTALHLAEVAEHGGASSP